MATFEHLGVALSENYMYNESKSRLHLITSDECYNWVQNLLFSHLSKDIKIKINRAIKLYMGVKLGLYIKGRTQAARSLQIGCWGRYLGLKGEKVTGNWRKLHSVELHDFCSSPYIILADEMGVPCGIYEAGEKCVQGLGGET